VLLVLDITRIKRRLYQEKGSIKMKDNTPYQRFLIEQTTKIVRGLNALKNQGDDYDWIGLVAGCLLSELNIMELKILEQKVVKALKYKEDLK
jgi:hypothetical protein